MKKYLAVIMAVLMVTGLFGCEKIENQTEDSAADVTVENVKNLIEELPALEDVESMSLEDQRIVYDQTQAAYEAYSQLAEEERDMLSKEYEKIEELFGYFNTLVEPAE